MRLAKYKWYRKLTCGIWYKHRFTFDAYALHLNCYSDWWCRYNEINRYSKVIDIEYYDAR